MNIKLGERLAKCLSLVEGDSLADVGTDHGKLPVKALLEGIVRRAVAIDISPNSLNKARALSAEAGVELSCRVGDGLSPLGDESVDVSVIAGMGGREIVTILSRARTGAAKSYILVPHTDAPLLRSFLKERDMRIVFDEVVKEGGKYYPVIKVDPSLPWDPSHNVYFGGSGRIGKEYAAFRLQKVDKILSLREDSSLTEERKVLLERLSSFEG